MAFLLRVGDREVALAPGLFFIGRGEEADLLLDDAGASRKHAVLRVGMHTLTIEDLGSRNGVFVNGRRIHAIRELSAGDEITIGSQQLVVKDDGVRPKVDSDAATKPLNQNLPPVPPPPPQSVRALSLLSARELEVLEMLAVGHSQREIGEQLGVSTKTVETYRARIAEKLGLKTRADLIRYAVNVGILRPM